MTYLPTQERILEDLNAPVLKLSILDKYPLTDTLYLQTYNKYLYTLFSKYSKIKKDYPKLAEICLENICHIFENASRKDLLRKSHIWPDIFFEKAKAPLHNFLMQKNAWKKNISCFYIFFCKHFK